MSRTLLPERRPNLTIDAEWQGHPISITLGYDPETCQILEVFADAVTASSRHGQIGESIRDASTAISVALQYGTPVAALAKSLGTVPVYVLGQPTEAPASPIGAILKIMTEATQ